jgi:hypothetical protein
MMWCAFPYTIPCRTMLLHRYAYAALDKYYCDSGSSGDTPAHTHTHTHSPPPLSGLQLDAHAALLRAVRAEARALEGGAGTGAETGTETGGGASRALSLAAGGINAFLENPGAEFGSGSGSGAGGGSSSSAAAGAAPGANASALAGYARAHAGLPVLYGVCLQAQRLDPARHARRLRAAHDNNNYMYRSGGGDGGQ